jgi:uncharacterized protein (TIGR02391 family)
MHIADLVADVDVLVALEPDELGLRILQVLAMWPAFHEDQLQIVTFIKSALQGFGPTHRGDEIRQALSEAWAWLEGQALLIPNPRFMGGEMRVLSRKARRLGKEPTARRALSGHKLAKDTLHPNIREDVWALYHRARYDTAVLEAMKGVEVAVREASKLGDRDLGRDLMRKAFAVESGPLTDKSADRSEQQAMSDLFAGAIGAYKNPHSHRRIALDDPDEAAEIILLANHLLRIVDARRPRS